MRYKTKLIKNSSITKGNIQRNANFIFDYFV